MSSFLDRIRMTAILEHDGLVDRADLIRLDVGRRLNPADRAAMGQFFTPAPIARFMADLAEPNSEEIRLLDPGAGVGSLSAAWIARACRLNDRPSSIHLTAYEPDHNLAEHLRRTIEDCEVVCRSAGVAFRAEVITACPIESPVSGDQNFMGRDCPATGQFRSKYSKSDRPLWRERRSRTDSFPNARTCWCLRTQN
jgi:hypothetical protein